MTENPFFERPISEKKETMHGRWPFAEFTDIWDIAVDFETKIERELNKLIEHHLPDVGKMVTAGERS